MEHNNHELEDIIKDLNNIKELDQQNNNQIKKNIEKTQKIKNIETNINNSVKKNYWWVKNIKNPIKWLKNIIYSKKHTKSNTATEDIKQKEIIEEIPRIEEKDNYDTIINNINDLIYLNKEKKIWINEQDIEINNLKIDRTANNIKNLDKKLKKI